MYLENKYTRWYYAIIIAAQSQNRKKNNGVYYQNHHILPKSLGGDNSKDNLVNLTAREHFICHLLLTKMTIGNDCYKMKYALSTIVYCKNIGYGRYVPSSRLYDLIKNNHCKAIQDYWTEEKRKEQALKCKKQFTGSRSTPQTIKKLQNKTWTETAIKTRLDNCLKNAAKRKGVKNPKHGKKMFINYVNKNKLIFNKIWEMFDQGKNRRQIALELNISWDRINIAINNKEKVLNIIDNYYYDTET